MTKFILAIGLTVFVGLSFMAQTGEAYDENQAVGKIKSIDLQNGIIVISSQGSAVDSEDVKLSPVEFFLDDLMLPNEGESSSLSDFEVGDEVEINYSQDEDMFFATSLTKKLIQ